MKNKRTYSLTAKERKAKRMAEQNKENKRQTPAVKPTAQQKETTLAQAESAMISAQKYAKLSAFIVGGVACLAIVLILVALIVPVIMFIVNPYHGMDRVIARFNLSNGMVLEYEIDEDTYETAATNFIFLAKNKYFDNTVFYDAQNGWLRFGGYEAQPAGGSSSSDYKVTQHHAQNTTFCENFSALPTSSFKRVTAKFGYRLRADDGGTVDSLLAQEGILAYRYSDTATEFQFTYENQATDLIESLNNGSVQGTYTLPATMVGRALNAETIENLREIAATAKTNDRITNGYLWRPPTPDIKISSVNLYNLNGEKWDNFNFLEYVRSDNGKRLSQWIDVI